MTSEVVGGAPFAVVDLFAGCGGLTEGFHQYRPEGEAAPVFRTVGAVEWEPAAAATYAANFGSASERVDASTASEVICRDIVGWEPRWMPGEIDVVVGGPPCQGFSGLNREKVRAERNTLWQEFIRVVVALQPKVFVIENVDRFLRSAEFRDLKQRIGGVDLTNYRLVDAGSKPGESEWEQDRRYLLNAADFGSPQARRRAIVIGIRTDAGLDADLLRYPVSTHSKKLLLHRLAPEGPTSQLAENKAWETVDSVFAESAKMQIAADLPASQPRPVDGVVGQFVGPFTTTQLHVGRKPEAISLSRYRAIPVRGNRKDLRGRYVCRFAGGAELILQKIGEPRRGDGGLDVPGEYVVVERGLRTERRVDVLDVIAEDAGGSGGRRTKSAKYRAVLVQGASTRRVELEYLSTEAWDAHDTGAGDVMGRIRTGMPSVTIRTEFFKPEKGRYLHPSEDRPLTLFEAARLQGFPNDFQWYGSKIDISRQIGNAVPIPLGRKIAESVYTYLAQDRRR